jgi:hypothetical protein
MRHLFGGHSCQLQKSIFHPGLVHWGYLISNLHLRFPSRLFFEHLEADLKAVQANHQNACASSQR